MSIELRPIGFVRTEAKEVPRHWSVSDVEGTLHIDEEYLEGLKDIEPSQRIVVIFNFHRSPEFSAEFLRQTENDAAQGDRRPPAAHVRGRAGTAVRYWACRRRSEERRWSSKNPSSSRT